ncbi:hypothetical protein Acr_23g0010110 [Actinidia rufa]|uniref:Uncharacterized protein n=1 Tax=Actinidia rufa TaxID=165716 RepID=A0A7J0GP76_9ERIC|nr:hypothetical protein Acr_23g0010110 [Actinidia rufa]
MVEEEVVSLPFMTGLVCEYCVVEGECYPVCWSVGALSSELYTMRVCLGVGPCLIDFGFAVWSALFLRGKIFCVIVRFGVEGSPNRFHDILFALVSLHSWGIVYVPCLVPGCVVGASLVVAMAVMTLDFPKAAWNLLLRLGLAPLSPPPPPSTTEEFANDAITQAAQGKNSLHIIDRGTLETLQWPSLIRSLASRADGPPKSVCITAVLGDLQNPCSFDLQSSIKSSIDEAGHKGFL